MDKNQWLLWRHNAITASDAACLYGLSPYKKIDKLYAEKMQLLPTEEPTNFIMAKGNSLEPILRQRFAAWWSLENTEDPFEPELCELEGYPFIRASLDGLSKCKRVLVEIKYVGAKVLAAGMVPEHYRIQVQHQMLCSGAQQGFVCMGNAPTGSDMRIIPVPRDNAFINQHLIMCEQFWQNVQMRKAPPSSVVDVIDSKAIALADEYKRLKEVSDEIATELENVRAELLQFVNSDEARVNGLHIKKILTKGSVDYSKIEALKNIDLEQFRKESRVSYKISIE